MEQLSPFGITVRESPNAILNVSSRRSIGSTKHGTGPVAGSASAWRSPHGSWRCTAAMRKRETRPTAVSLSSCGFPTLQRRKHKDLLECDLQVSLGRLLLK